MNLWETIAPFGTGPICWASLQREIADMFFTELPATLMSVGHMASPEEIDAYQTTAENEFHEVSATALGMDRSPYEQAAALGRIQWRRADTAQLHPPCQIRIDGAPWRNLIEPMKP